MSSPVKEQLRNHQSPPIDDSSDFGQPVGITERVETWQSGVDIQPYAAQPADANIIGDLFQRCVDLLSLCLVDQRISSPLRHHSVLKQSLQGLHLWGDGNRVAEGHLDTELRGSKELYESVLSRLVSIAELLINCMSFREIQLAAYAKLQQVCSSILCPIKSFAGRF
jgi:hypothetical protein